MKISEKNDCCVNLKKRKEEEAHIQESTILKK